MRHKIVTLCVKMCLILSVDPKTTQNRSIWAKGYCPFLRGLGIDLSESAIQ